MDLAMEEYLEKVTEVRQDTEKLMEMVEEALESVKRAMEDAKIWSQQMAVRYPEKVTVEEAETSRKRSAERSEDGKDMVPVKKIPQQCNSDSVRWFQHQVLGLLGLLPTVHDFLSKNCSSIDVSKLRLF
ncbi:unnamed protein product [Caenorhabditis nigoni]